jgi:acetolactate synthase-1/2/3 large subunit
MDTAAEMLRSGKPTGIVLAGAGLSAAGLAIAGRIAAVTGAELFAPYSVARIERGAGRVPVERIPYVIDQAVARLAKFSQMILIGAPAPVAFFAYPNKPSVVTPEGCRIHTLARPEEDLLAALDALADAVSAGKVAPPVQKLIRPGLPSGAFTLAGLAEVIASLIPENAIVVDEAITSGRGLGSVTQGALPHDWLAGTGGSIGFAMPVAIGAAIACPDRRVLCLESDGSAMYTPQALWTMARESLNVTTVLFANRSYNILKTELANVGAGNPGRKALDMLEIGHPDLGWQDLARGMGVPASRATNLEEFAKQLAAGLNTAGPTLIEAVL